MCVCLEKNSEKKFNDCISHVSNVRRACLIKSVCTEVVSSTLPKNSIVWWVPRVTIAVFQYQKSFIIPLTCHIEQTKMLFCCCDFLYFSLIFCVCDHSLSYLRKLLENEDAPEAAFLFLNSMVAFIEVHRQCFGFVLHPFASELIKLRKTILLLPIKKLPLKLHVVTAHLKQRCVCACVRVCSVCARLI